MKTKFSTALSLAVIAAMLVTSFVLADPIANNIDTTIDAALETRTIASGDSTVVGFFIVGSNVDPSPDAPGCNATGSAPATVTLDVPSGVTATPSSFPVVGCYNPTDATGTVVNVTFSSSTAGSYTIAVSSVTGGKSGSQWNTAPAAFTLVVTAFYDFAGFYQPIDNTIVNSAKAGQAIPVKYRLTDANGAPISDPTHFVSVTSTSSGACSGVADDIETYAGSSGLQYLGDGYWQYNWKTPKAYAGQCRTMSLNLNDGSNHTASFTFK